MLQEAGTWDRDFAHYVYWLMEGDAPLYVGRSSSSLRARVRNHSYSGWFPRVTSIRAKELPTLAECKAYEKAIIDNHRPPKNRRNW